MAQYGRREELKSAEPRRLSPSQSSDEFGRQEGRVGWGRTA